MSKELESLETLKDMLIGNGINDNINDYVDNLILPIKQALARLESIDNANPSEALECLEILYYNLKSHMSKENPMFDLEYDTIKQALIKVQEQEKVLNEALKLNSEWAEELDYYKDLQESKKHLKWEDLEEQLGCPLDVYVKLVQDTEIFDVKKRLYYVKGIADVCGSYVVNTIWFNKQGEELEHSFYLRDYKKTWWLKKDKKE